MKNIIAILFLIHLFTSAYAYGALTREYSSTNEKIIGWVGMFAIGVFITYAIIQTK